MVSEKIEIKLETSDKKREQENFDERERKSAEDFRLQSGAFREREKLRAAHHWYVLQTDVRRT